MYFLQTLDKVKGNFDVTLKAYCVTKLLFHFVIRFVVVTRRHKYKQFLCKIKSSFSYSLTPRIFIVFRRQHVKQSIMGRSHHQSILVVLLGPKNQNKHISDLCCNLRRAITVHFLKFVPSFILLSIFHVIFNSHTRFACQLYSIKFVSQSIIILKLKWSL